MTMERLHHKRGRSEKLTAKEQETLTKLLLEYDKYMLIRAEALNLLIQRGQDVSKLLRNIKENLGHDRTTPSN
jgi:molybdenum-dependent DNA-binding transcriptional regulator ModE